MSEQTFNKYDAVKWASGAAGRTIEKMGIVEKVVAAGEVPDLKYYADAGFSLMFDGIGPRKHNSYLVAVASINSRRPVKPKLYWPRVSNLVLVAEGHLHTEEPANVG